MHRTVAVGLALVFGCATGTVASHYVSPPAEAQDPGRQKWRHHCQDDVGRDDLYKLGEDGWEMVGLSYTGDFENYRYCFKRPL